MHRSDLLRRIEQTLVTLMNTVVHIPLFPTIVLTRSISFHFCSMTLNSQCNAMHNTACTTSDTVTCTTKMTIGTKETLNTLQQKFKHCESIIKSRGDGQQLDPRYQRIFYLGRELKTGSRSLEALMGSHLRLSKVLHLHYSQPVKKSKIKTKDTNMSTNTQTVTLDLENDDWNDDDGDGDDDDDDDDDDSIEIQEVSVSRTNMQTRKRPPQPQLPPQGVNVNVAGMRPSPKSAGGVVELLDSDDSDDEIEIIENGLSSKKARAT